MLGVASGPSVIATRALAKFVFDFKTSERQRVFVVGEVGPQATSGGLVKMPIRSLHGLHGELDARSAVPHVDVEHR